MIGSKILARKAVGALFELQLLPSASPAHRVLEDFPERLTGEEHVVLDLPHYPACWLVFLQGSFNNMQQIVFSVCTVS